jgi:hypothetical protein
VTAFDDLFKGFGGDQPAPAAPRPADVHAWRRDQASRRNACAANGHQYQVAGKTTPTAVLCKRCGVRWAVGARTEPTEPMGVGRG